MSDQTSAWITGREAAAILGRPTAGIHAVMRHYGLAGVLFSAVFGGTTSTARRLYLRAEVLALAERLRAGSPRPTPEPGPLFPPENGSPYPSVPAGRPLSLPPAPARPGATGGATEGKPGRSCSHPLILEREGAQVCGRCGHRLRAHEVLRAGSPEVPD